MIQATPTYCIELLSTRLGFHQPAGNTAIPLYRSAGTTAIAAAQTVLERNLAQYGCSRLISTELPRAAHILVRCSDVHTFSRLSLSLSCCFSRRQPPIPIAVIDTALTVRGHMWSTVVQEPAVCAAIVLDDRTVSGFALRHAVCKRHRPETGRQALV